MRTIMIAAMIGVAVLLNGVARADEPVAIRVGWSSANASIVPDYFQDPKNHQEVAGLLASFTKQPPEQMGWMFTDGDFYRDPSGKPNLKVMQANIDQLHDLGIVPATFDVASYADLGPISDAAARLAK